MSCDSLLSELIVCVGMWIVCFRLVSVCVIVCWIYYVVYVENLKLCW